jgi:hypothetical protein
VILASYMSTMDLGCRVPNGQPGMPDWCARGVTRGARDEVKGGFYALEEMNLPFSV